MSDKIQRPYNEHKCRVCEEKEKWKPFLSNLSWATHNQQKWLPISLKRVANNNMKTYNCLLLTLQKSEQAALWGI